MTTDLKDEPMQEYVHETESRLQHDKNRKQRVWILNILNVAVDLAD